MHFRSGPVVDLVRTDDGSAVALLDNGRVLVLTEIAAWIVEHIRSAGITGCELGQLTAAVVDEFGDPGDPSSRLREILLELTDVGVVLPRD